MPDRPGFVWRMRDGRLLLALLAGLLWAAPLRAQDGFRQTGVPAEATAENGVLAREQALANGRRTAWERLVAEAGAAPIPLSDRQIEGMVSSIVIEQERPSPTRYTGRITVNFVPGRVRGILGSRAAALGGGTASSGTAPGGAGYPGAGVIAPPAAPVPVTNWVEAVATYRSMAEWLELRRRLNGASPVSAVQIQGIAIDAARLRLGLRGAPDAAAVELAGLGVALVPPTAPPEQWRVGLAGGR